VDYLEKGESKNEEEKKISIYSLKKIQANKSIGKKLSPEEDDKSDLTVSPKTLYPFE